MHCPKPWFCVTVSVFVLLTGINTNALAQSVRPALAAPEVRGETPVPPIIASGSLIPGGGQHSVGSFSMDVYNPEMDNFLKAPASPLGLFGMHVKDVEETLRGYGGKPYSYAFGKYSRVTISVYLVTLLFDRDRRLGAIRVDPRPPFSQVEAKARAFFLKLFLNKADLTAFRMVMTPGYLEIRYDPPETTDDQSRGSAIGEDSVAEPSE